MPGHAPNTRAGIARGADFGEGFAAHFDDVFHITKGFNIVDDGGALIQAQRRREIRRFDTRVGAVALKGFNQAGLFTTDVCPRAAVHDDVTGITGTQNIISEQILRACLLNRFLQNAVTLKEFPPYVDEGELRLNRKGRTEHALDQLMRILVNDLTVLEGAGFRFVGIAD